MHDTSTRTLARLDRFRRESLLPAVYRAAAPLEISCWEAGPDPVPASVAFEAEYHSIVAGTAYGAPWATTWLHVTGEVPEGWAREPEAARVELVVDLGFTAGPAAGFQVEGLAYRPDGTILKAIEKYNSYLPVDHLSRAIDVYIEVASNPDVLGDQWSNTPSPLGLPATAGVESLYALGSIEVRLLDLEVQRLADDMRVLGDLAAELPEHSPRRSKILAAFDDVMDIVDPADVAATAASARTVLKRLLESRSAASAHEIYAVGHAHIDSAWLWPVRETVRKVARTFANVLDLMDNDPDFIFAASSAQQYAWLKVAYPQLFERVRARVAEGRFVPVGGMWVESDTNMVGGEALVRQFLEGKAFFREEFAVESREVWLPDSFGYSAALPQIIRGVGSGRLLTQKMSWNDTNTLPHHTFRWLGIDGTDVFTHFPPVDTYNSVLSGEELARAERQFRDSARAGKSLAPFGYGDGGGGPTREMLASAHRTADLEGSPRVILASPRQFFDDAEAEYLSPPTWAGELYLEFHRGVYTSQHRTKRGNRRSEHLLHAAEAWCAAASVRAGSPYPSETLRRIWREVLLQQFHDILPGTSIAWVHREAEANYTRIEAELRQIIDTALRALAGTGSRILTANPSPVPLDGVPAGAVAERVQPNGRAHLRKDGDRFVLSNDAVSIEIGPDGTIESIFDLAQKRGLVPRGTRFGVLRVFRDRPGQWEAWDIDEDYRRSAIDILDVEDLTVHADTEQLVGVTVRRRHGASSFQQRIELAAGTNRIDLWTAVDWHERRTLLKLSLPLQVRADWAASEIQFGHIRRPIVKNTSWDAARFETVAHRWVQVGEPGYSIAVANDSTYGHDITPVDGSTVAIGESLLRSPMVPDPEADQGRHEFRTSISFGGGTTAAVIDGYRLNSELTTIEGDHPVEPLAWIEGAGHSPSSSVMLETTKLAEDGSGDVVLRVYESEGDTARATLHLGFPAHSLIPCDLLERPEGDPEPVENGIASIALRPFGIRTYRVRWS